MIPPQELKKKSFTRAMRGYEPVEVDEHINFLIEKYSELFTQCDRYDKKLRLVAERISEIQSEEEAIHKLAITTQKHCDLQIEDASAAAKKIIEEAKETAEKIIEESKKNAEKILDEINSKAQVQIETASMKSDALLMSARTQCVKILNSFKKEIINQRENLENIKTFSDDFQARMLAGYKEHLGRLTNMRSEPIDLGKFSDFLLLDTLMAEIKKDAVKIADYNSDKNINYSENLENLDPDKMISSIIGSKKREPVQIEPEPAAIEIEEEDVREYKEPVKAGVSTKTFDRTKPRTAEEAQDEKVIATYDSDDFDEQQQKMHKQQETEKKPESFYHQEEVEYIDDEFENSRDNVFEKKQSESDVENFDESPEEIPDDYEEKSEKKKGFFSFFKNKKEKNKKDEYIDSDDDDYEDGEEDDNSSIFDDLEDDE